MQGTSFTSKPSSIKLKYELLLEDFILSKKKKKMDWVNNGINGKNSMRLYSSCKLLKSCTTGCLDSFLILFLEDFVCLNYKILCIDVMFIIYESFRYIPIMILVTLNN